MKKHSFSRPNDDELLVFEIILDDHKLRFALDTGATHSLVDLNVLLMLGYSTELDAETIPLETANGITQANKRIVNRLSALGINRTNFHILTYDFIAGGITSFYDGMLGLDFFNETVLTIDFIEQKAWLHD
jgi:Aspartyl protease